MNPQIKFSHNWNNKLGNKIFTTIRKATPEKERYYHSKLAKVFDIVLNEEIVGEAKLWRIDTRKFLECDEYLLTLDTGEINVPTQFEIFRKFGVKPEDEILILTFERQGEKNE